MKEKINFATALDLIKCLKQREKKQRLLPTCAPISELPSNISTMLMTVLSPLQLEIKSGMRLLFFL